MLGIMSATFTRPLSFINCKVNEFIILDSTINEIIADFSYCQKMICSFDSKFQRLSFTGRTNTVFNELWLSLNAIEEKIFISNCNFKKLNITSYLTGLQKDKELEISNCKVNSFYINSLSNSGLFKLINIQSLNLANENSFFTIDKSNLGKAEFIQFDFSSFTEVNILNSFLGDCIFVNTVNRFRRT